MTLRNKLQWNINRNSNIFIHENVFESVVYEMASFLSRPQCVNLLSIGFMYVRDQNLVINEPAYVLTPNGASPPGAVIATKLVDIYIYISLVISDYVSALLIGWRDWKWLNGWKNLGRYRVTPSLEYICRTYAWVTALFGLNTMRTHKTEYLWYFFTVFRFVPYHYIFVPRFVIGYNR